MSYSETLSEHTQAHTAMCTICQVQQHLLVFATQEDKSEKIKRAQKWEISLGSIAQLSQNKKNYPTER